MIYSATTLFSTPFQGLPRHLLNEWTVTWNSEKSATYSIERNGAGEVVMMVAECSWNGCENKEPVPVVGSSNSDYPGYEGYVQGVNIHNGAIVYMSRGVNNTASMVLLDGGEKYTAQGQAVGELPFLEDWDSIFFLS